MTIEEFRKDQVRVEAARELLANPTLKEMIEVLRNDGPEMKPSSGLTPHDANIRHGYIYGYAAHHRFLQSLGERWPLDREALPATYEDPEPEE